MFKKRAKLSGGVDSKRRRLVEPSQVDRNKKSDLTDEQPNITNESGKDDILTTNTSTVIVTTTKADSKIPKDKDNVVHEHSNLSEEENGSNLQDKVNSAIKTFLNKPKLVGSSKQIKQASNLKTTILMDYQPDICKDFKQTGYCGYGDNCKFLHSRDDFKTGWKLNKDWEEFNKSNYKEGKTTHSDFKKKIDETIKDIPFKCVLCHNDYKKPVVTTCQHYFCNKCFFQRIKDTGNKKCIICGHDTKGSAKVATELQKILELQKSAE